jgi:hypothetical protein
MSDTCPPPDGGQWFWARHRRRGCWTVLYVAGGVVSACRPHGPAAIEDFEDFREINPPVLKGGLEGCHSAPEGT